MRMQPFAPAATDALTTIGGPAAVKALLPLLADPKPEARRVAVTALGALKNRAAIEPLLKAYKDPETRYDAIAALAEVGTASLPLAFKTFIGLPYLRYLPTQDFPTYEG
jgi:HEAT repeat protein